MKKVCSAPSFLERGDRESALRHFAELKKLDRELAAQLAKHIYRDYLLDASTFEK